jgi:hypothetical protein
MDLLQPILSADRKGTGSRAYQKTEGYRNKTQTARGID